MDTLSIREIIEQVDRGQVRVPAFQRGFVWDPDRVAFFFDSIFKKYPFGSLLLWRAEDPLNCERKLGPFELPDPVADYPLDYVLDGQQRITSLYVALETGKEVEQSSDWKDVYCTFSILKFEFGLNCSSLDKRDSFVRPTHRSHRPSS